MMAASHEQLRDWQSEVPQKRQVVTSFFLARRISILQMAIRFFRELLSAVAVEPLNKAGLTSGGCLPCQNDNKFLITERS